MNRLFSFLALTILITFSCKPTPKGGEINNTYWSLVSITKGRKVTNLTPTDKITAAITNNSITGDCICNSYTVDIKLDGPTLQAAEISTSEKACDGLDLENNYLNQLMKATGYTVDKGRLDIFTEEGKLSFRSMTETEAGQYKKLQLIITARELFSVLNADSVLHLYPIMNVDNPGTYPFAGISIDPRLYDVFDSKLSETWKKDEGQVYAIGRYNDLYICRVPGRYVSSDLAVFRIQENTFTHVETVAWSWCNEGWCNQQDAWLQKVNGDEFVDIVTRYEYRDDKNRLKEERMGLLIQNAQGDFVPNTDLRLNKANFKMAKI